MNPQPLLTWQFRTPTFTPDASAEPPSASMAASMAADPVAARIDFNIVSKLLVFRGARPV
jgi:hypothetical protein